MKVVESMALSRSGHHSMKNWIIQNLVGFQIKWEYKLINCSGTKFYHLGEANHDIPLSYQYLEKIKDDADFVLVNYEDTPWDYTLLNKNKVFQGQYNLDFGRQYNVDHQGRIVFIRDFYNNLTSRIESNNRQIFNKWNEDKPHLFKVDHIYIERWKNLARACVKNNVSYLKFEDWLYNKEVRERFLWDNFRIHDKYGIKNIQGSQSSFIDNNEYSDRLKLVEIPEETKDSIRKDNELHYLLGSLGYEYKEI